MFFIPRVSEDLLWAKPCLSAFRAFPSNRQSAWPGALLRNSMTLICVLWRGEHFWDVIVFQRVHFSNLAFVYLWYSSNQICASNSRFTSRVAQSVQCLTTDWTTGVRTPTGAEDFSSNLLTSASRPALGPTQLPVLWVPGALSRG
jgi:hypothetical protein